MLLCRNQNWKKIPARQLLAAGLFIVALGASWPHTISPRGWLAPNGNDFAQGFCYGLGITLELLSAYALYRQRRQS